MGSYKHLSCEERTMIQLSLAPRAEFDQPRIAP